MEENGGPIYSTAEKVTSVVLIFVIILIMSKFVYYDAERFGKGVKIGFAVFWAAIAVALAIFKNARILLFKRWLRFMVYMPIIIIGIIIIGIVVYFFQSLAASSGMGDGSE